MASPVPQVSAWSSGASVWLAWRQAIDSSTLVDAFRVGVKLPTWLGLGALLYASVAFLPQVSPRRVTPLRRPMGEEEPMRAAI